MNRLSGEDSACAETRALRPNPVMRSQASHTTGTGYRRAAIHSGGKIRASSFMIYAAKRDAGPRNHRL
jgi:hypothetical protein